MVLTKRSLSLSLRDEEIKKNAAIIDGQKRKEKKVKVLREKG